MNDSPTPTPPPKGRGLSLRDEAKRLSTPPLQGRGRGWGVSASRLEELHTRAREMRNNPTEPEKRLWRVLSGKQIGAKFRRQAVTISQPGDWKQAGPNHWVLDRQNEKRNDA